MTHRLVSAVPIIPARDIALSAAWYRDMLGFTEQPWGATEFAVRDLDGNLVTFFQFKVAE